MGRSIDKGFARCNFSCAVALAVLLAAGCGSGSGAGDGAPLPAAETSTSAAEPAAPIATPGQPMEYLSLDLGQMRGFNFDGDQPFVNPQTGRSDIAGLSFNGTGLRNSEISNAGSGTAHITKFLDAAANYEVTRIRLLDTDNSSSDGYRTQFNSFRFDPDKTYLLDLEFKLDADWDFGMTPGAGLLWQVKGDPKPGQWGNPVLALNLVGNQLRLSVLYPAPAMAAETWPTSVQWVDAEYVDVTIPAVALQAGVYHHVSILFHADERPAAFGGKGFLHAWFDEQQWHRYTGPTLHPDQNGRHRIDFGWYQWEGKPTATRTIYFKTARLYEWR